MPVLSIVIPVLNEADNLKELLPKLNQVLQNSVGEFELIVVDGQSVDGSAQVAEALGAHVIQQSNPGYGGALETGFREANGKYILTLDADLSHNPSYIGSMWDMRRSAEVIIASRYVRGGSSEANSFRQALSKVLNRGMGQLLDIEVTDLSSGFRMYRSDVVKGMSIQWRNFAALVEIIVRAYADGWRVVEVPFHYQARRYGQTHAQVMRFGMEFLRTAYQMWKLRNSIACADYDARAYDSRIPFQRYWQRRRYEVVTQMAQGQGKILDVGCGSSRILTALKGTGFGVDIQPNKLRYARHYGIPLINADAFHLPFASNFFDCVICSQLIEHLPPDSSVFREMARVLRTGGSLVLGTPDYGTLAWRIIERMYGLAAPGAYADEHITHYTKASLKELLERFAFDVQATEYVFGAELVVMAKKRSLLSS